MPCRAVSIDTLEGALLLETEPSSIFFFSRLRGLSFFFFFHYLRVFFFFSASNLEPRLGAVTPPSGVAHEVAMCFGSLAEGDGAYAALPPRVVVTHALRAA